MSQEHFTENLLALSGIQHFFFCRRQWALIHVEMQWRENVLTVEGKQLHERVDDPFFNESRNGTVIARAVPVASYSLGLFGVCDVVEFKPSATEVAEAMRLPKRDGLFVPAPVEYKRGRPKHGPMDEAQLCAQAMCLEEMFSVPINIGYLYYGQTRHREPVEFTSQLRDLVKKAAEEMHAYFRRGYTPLVRPHKGCRSCSLASVCLPELQKKRLPVTKYIERAINE